MGKMKERRKRVGKKEGRKERKVEEAIRWDLNILKLFYIVLLHHVQLGLVRLSVLSYYNVNSLFHSC